MRLLRKMPPKCRYCKEIWWSTAKQFNKSEQKISMMLFCLYAITSFFSRAKELQIVQPAGVKHALDATVNDNRQNIKQRKMMVLKILTHGISQTPLLIQFV